MTRSSVPTRQRLIQAALQLFAAQGITETTTRQIAELADVNEVTLFRHFGSKYGLLLAVIEDAEVFTRLGEILGWQASNTNSISEALENYASVGLHALEQIPELVRSLIGEAGHYPPENRQALGRGFTQANDYTAQYLTTVLHHQRAQTHLPVPKLASLLNSLMLGYVILKLTSEEDSLWQDQDEFLGDVVSLFLGGAISQPGSELEPLHQLGLPQLAARPAEVADLPASQVRSILRHARKISLQDYALAYVLLGAGLSASEIAGLERSHSLYESHQHLLQVVKGNVRQVPLNQWIMGQRYGSHSHNPLSQWIKSRKDNQPALFLNEAGKPLSEVEIRVRWQLWIEDLLTPQGYPPNITQAQETWRLEMLMRGVSQEDLSILAGVDVAELQPYIRRAREKLALEQAIRLDQKNSANGLGEHIQRQPDTS